jgi:hypothetical protein
VLNLPGLQRLLDQLAVGEELAIAEKDVVRLFGINDVMHARIRGFASGHRCTPIFVDGSLVFRKNRLLPPRS